MIWAEMWNIYIEYYVIVIYFALDLLGGEEEDIIHCVYNCLPV